MQPIETKPACDCLQHPERQPCADCAKREHDAWLQRWNAEMRFEYGDTL